ncbi:tetratricopeptide repeat protein 12-like [Plodia interpunctella]|uniref:tetratricopeptide repeat protein 12-like n=1 Tax=Plodia interpunctella TaxID=58824 RepID=UPI0023679D73|nr:tetratricopeptide repeat protein 12-like [Plodia interpunctella]
MGSRNLRANPAFKEYQDMERDEEWANFTKRVGDVTKIVHDLASGDKAKSDAAQALADKYLGGKVIIDDNIEMKIKSDRTVINQKAFSSMGKQDEGEMDKDAWMAEVSKDAEKRAQDRKIRREKADTFNTQAIKAFRRGEYDRALSCYNRAIEQIRDNPMLYCDRALTNIKLGKYDKVFADCDMALRIYENSFKARLYTAKAYKELEELEKYETSRKELDEMFPQHAELITYFLDKKQQVEEEEEEEED